MRRILLPRPARPLLIVLLAAVQLACGPVVSTPAPMPPTSSPVLSPTAGAVPTVPASPSPNASPTTAPAVAQRPPPTAPPTRAAASPTNAATTGPDVATVAPVARPTVAGAIDLPIFDTHLHYSQDAWAQYPPAVILAILERAGVYRALISSTPDDGTLRLYELAPDRVVPVLRPYRTRDDMGSWTADPGVLRYVRTRLERPIYRGIGEFHLSGGQSEDEVVGAIAALSAEKGLFLHAHADAAAVEELLRRRADSRVLWAHAGMSAAPETIGRLLGRYPHLWVELALRGDVAPGGSLDPEWGELFARFPDRFMVGTDTWIPSRWAQLPSVMDDTRRWLRQLPRELAEAIAFGNAERRFGR